MPARHAGLRYRPRRERAWSNPLLRGLMRQGLLRVGLLRLELLRLGLLR